MIVKQADLFFEKLPLDLLEPNAARVMDTLLDRMI